MVLTDMDFTLDLYAYRSDNYLVEYGQRMMDRMIFRSVIVDATESVCADIPKCLPLLGL